MSISVLKIKKIEKFLYLYDEKKYDFKYCIAAFSLAISSCIIEGLKSYPQIKVVTLNGDWEVAGAKALMKKYLAGMLSSGITMLRMRELGGLLYVGLCNQLLPPL